MTRAFDLDRESRAFAQQITTLLNATIAENVRLTAVDLPGRRVLVGYGITTKRPLPQAFPLRKPSWRGTQLHMSVSYSLEADREGRYLQVWNSVFALFNAAAAGSASELFHVDYERDKQDGYPEAHLQLRAEGASWAAVLGSRQPLCKLHFPVGGRRFRPTLEDIAEFLIVERLAGAGPNASEHIAAGREDFWRRQLCAAIRNHPDAARAALAELD